MVKHGTQKKRRSGLKTTRKPKKHIAVRVANKVTDSAIRAAWDKSLSPADNLSNFGLNANPNQSLAGAVTGLGRKKLPKPPNANSAAFLGMAKIPTETDLAQDSLADPNPKRRIMSEADQEYAVRCIKKYGTNYAKMAGDIKVNAKQHTEHKLEKMCELYGALSESERLVSL
jgi:hypothetical protein